MHRISRITTNFGGKSSTAPLPPLAPRKNCKLGALTILWGGNLRFTKTNIWSLPVKTADFIASYSSNWERRKSASCCNATNWAGCSNWWQYSRFMTSWSCSAYFRSNFKHIYFVKDANYDMNENILLHKPCYQKPSETGIDCSRKRLWKRLAHIVNKWDCGSIDMNCWTRQARIGNKWACASICQKCNDPPTPRMILSSDEIYLMLCARI